MNWKYKFHFEDLWKAFDDAEITPADMGKEVAKRLDASPYTGQLVDITMAFESVEGPWDEEEEFNSALEDLYDWADANSVWINTF